MSNDHDNVKYLTGQAVIVAYLAEKKYNRNYQIATQDFLANIHDMYKEDFHKFPDRAAEVVQKYKDLIDALPETGE